MGRAWIGLILMAGVTSLPELITGISSVTLAGAPDIALGDVMGSCVFNLSLIALMDMLQGRKPIFSECEQGHILSAGFGFILIGLAVLSILAGRHVPAIAHIGLYTPAMVLVYAVAVRSVFLFERRRVSEFVGETAEAAHYEQVTMREAVAKYALHALLIVGAATWLPVIADGIAEQTGLGRSFVGGVFVALTTSLPELVVSVSALRIGAADMAIANLFGSNMFNIFILGVDDLFFLRGPLLSHVSSNHAVTGVIAIIMTGIVIVSLAYRTKKKMFLRLGWDAVALILAYVVNIYLLYALRGRG
jgi:cation:H+ antiporter